jgi:hypothetical protein
MAADDLTGQWCQRDRAADSVALRAGAVHQCFEGEQPLLGQRLVDAQTTGPFEIARCLGNRCGSLPAQGEGLAKGVLVGQGGGRTKALVVRPEDSLAKVDRLVRPPGPGSGVAGLHVGLEPCTQTESDIHRVGQRQAKPCQEGAIFRLGREQPLLR